MPLGLGLGSATSPLAPVLMCGMSSELGAKSLGFMPMSASSWLGNSGKFCSLSGPLRPHLTGRSNNHAQQCCENGCDHVG